MRRRTFLRVTGMSALAVGLGAGATACLRDPDANGLRLLAGFSSRRVATTGELVASTGYRWHTDPDGGACFPASGGGWIYVSNSESVFGGASMIRFSSTGAIVEARRILGGTIANCAGGATPWGTWLSCEELATGRVFECDPTGASEAVVRPALGTFQHEATAADPVAQVIYLTEDQSDGCFYRFRPTTWGDLSSGVLEVMTEVAGTIGWAAVPEPNPILTTPTREQVPEAKHFRGGEGVVMAGADVVFTTKGDNRVWRYSPGSNALSVVYDAAAVTSPTLTGVDNVTERSGNLYVCEDGGDMQIVRIRPDGATEAVLQLDGVADSELTGVAFSPDGSRMYFSSQRNPGATYEVAGPW